MKSVETHSDPLNQSTSVKICRNPSRVHQNTSKSVKIRHNPSKFNKNPSQTEIREMRRNLSKSVGIRTVSSRVIGPPINFRSLQNFRYPHRQNPSKAVSCGIFGPFFCLWDLVYTWRRSNFLFRTQSGPSHIVGPLSDSRAPLANSRAPLA